MMNIKPVIFGIMAMRNKYEGVTTRFLRPDERFIQSNEHEMPLVIEASTSSDAQWLKKFVSTYSVQLLEDTSYYGAILFRGFDISSEEQFEQTIINIQGLQGISEAFMSEEGRIHTGQSKYVLHTNAVYKTGGTLYLGGFHSENYYSPDVPGYICFCCFEPSRLGGETGLINMKKAYKNMDQSLKDKLENKPFFVSKWLMSDVVKRYNISTDKIEKICNDFKLPIVGEGKNKFIYMYKPSVFQSHRTKEKALFINLFEIHRLNANLRKLFMQDYSQKEWFWHRFVWKMPKRIFKSIKFIYIIFASFFYSPKDSMNIFLSKLRIYYAEKTNKNLPEFHEKRVGSCFNEQDVIHLAKSIYSDYCSFLWHKGDVLLIDNTQVMHAGMPGAGPRLIRAMICNSIEMNYSPSAEGCLVDEVIRPSSIGETILKTS